MMEQKNICIINNDPFIAKLLKDYFSRYPCSIDETNSSDTALKLASSNNYKLIFVDFTLPVLNGAELTNEIKKKNKNAVVIGMSASGRDKDAFQQAGADHFLAKPFNFKTLDILIQRFCELH